MAHKILLYLSHLAVLTLSVNGWSLINRWIDIAKTPRQCLDVSYSAANELRNVANHRNRCDRQLHEKETFKFSASHSDRSACIQLCRGCLVE